MEVYKITCLVNHKVYIGSTKFTKEVRWGDLSSSSSHLSRARAGAESPLYEDIRTYGEDKFLLETLEYVKDSRLAAYRREDFWIKKYWSDLGEDMMYNKYNSACGHDDWTVPHNPEFQQKATESRRSKYGSANAKCLTPEAIKKAQATKLDRYGTISNCDINPESRQSQIEKVSKHYIDTKLGDQVIGYSSILDRLLNEGYDITYWVVKRIVSGSASNRSRSKYPELVTRFKLIENEE